MPTVSTTWRRALCITGLCLAAAFTGAALQPATAQNNGTIPSPPPTSVAIVDLGKLLDGIDEAADARKRIKDQEDKYNASLDQLRAQAKTINTDLEMLKGKESTPEYLAKKAASLEIEAQLETRFKTSKALMDLHLGENLRGLYVRIFDVVDRFGKQNGYDLILIDDRHLVPRPGTTGAQVANLMNDRRILYANEAKLDITQQVITMMNNEFKAGKR